MKFFETPLGKAVLEGLRVMVLAIIPVASSFLGNWEFDWKAILIVAGLSILKSLDKYLHEAAKEEPAKTRNEGLGGITGLTGF